MGDNILGCFLKVGFDPNLKRGEAHELGNQVSLYIWGERGTAGISGNLKKLKIEDYGKDLNLVLLEFHVKPTPTELSYLKEIEPYRKKEKSILVSIDSFRNRYRSSSVLLKKLSSVMMIGIPMDF